LEAQGNIQALLESNRGDYARRLYHRYVMGDSSWGILPEDELQAQLNWDDSETEANNLRLQAIQAELQATEGILVQQFGKIGALIALLGFVIAIGLSRQNADNTLTLKVVCLAAIYAVWAQSPRLKVFFRFRKREDAGLRTGNITTQWKAFYYAYCWLVRREHTTNAIEALVIVATFLTIIALGFVMFVA
jgi:tetrahydromethanopterin S-methyltransferase subunit G